MVEAYLLPNFRLVKKSLLLRNRYHFVKQHSEALTDNMR